MPAPLRVGIVGVGWGALVHGPAFRAVEGFELAALCGRRPEPLAQAAERLGIADTSDDWQSFVLRDDLDVISIVVPVALHRPVLMAALEAGKHVLCEKPVSLSAAEAAEMTAAVEASDRRVAVCFQYRWTPEHLAIRDFVAAGSLGDPFFVQVAQTAGYWHPAHPLQAEWMYRLDQGGGYLNGMASHDLDFLQTLFGPVASVCADVRTSVPVRARPDGSSLEVDADDTSALVMRMQSGALAVLTTSVVGCGAGTQVFEALGTAGTIEIARSQGAGTAITARVGAEAPAPLEAEARALRSGAELPKRRSAGAIHAQALLLEDWLPAFHGGLSGAPTMRDGWRVAAVIEAARASSAGAGWVDVPPAP